MATKKLAGSQDKFANVAIISCTESAANTLTFQKIETGVSIQEKVAWIINRLEYFITAPAAAIFNGDSDEFRFGLCVSKAITQVTLDDPTVLDINCITRLDYGAAANALLNYRPLIKDLSTMPGGGLLVSPNPLYAFAKGSGLASAMEVIVRMHYTGFVMTTEDYWDLVETRRVITN